MKCTFCGKDVSDEARICPHCGIYISRTFREPNGGISSGEDRGSPGGSQDYLNPREQRPEFSPADAAPKAQEDSGSFSDPDTAPMSDIVSESSPAQWQTPHDLPKEPDGNPEYSGNDGNPPVNDPRELRALNRRMDTVSGLVHAELFLALGGLPFFLVIIAAVIIGGIKYAELLRPLAGIPCFLVIIAGMVHAAVLFESLFEPVPLVTRVIRFFDRQGTEYRDWSAKGRRARVILITLLIFIGVFVAMFFLTMTFVVGNRGSAPLTESEKLALCIAGGIAGLLLITDIVLQIHAMIIFRDIKKKLKNMAAPAASFDGKTVKKPKRG